MIDLHNHILPGLDDGPQTFEETFEMCLISYRDGIRTIVATPHTLNSVYETSRSTILAKVQELNAAIKEKLISNPPPFPEPPARSGTRRPGSPGPEFLPDSASPMNLKIIPGADVHFSEEVLSQENQDKITTVADGGKFLLVEFPPWGIPHRAEAILFNLLARGITPIISHPERNLEIARSPQRYVEIVRMGCLGQITGGSLMGGFGRDARQAAVNLLRKNLVHFIASDAHSANGRPPVLSDAVRKAAKIVGKEQARKMVTEYPQAILEGRRPTLPEPLLKD
jgi:protein-tyrosine phosphatase